MRWVEGKIERRVTIAAPVARIWEQVSTVENLAEIIPQVESLRQEGDHVLWLLEEQGAGGISVRPRATTRIVFEPESAIRITDVPARDDTARIRGEILFRPEGDVTATQARLELEIGLPIPFFTVPVIRPVVQRKIDRIVDRLLDNVRRRVA